MVTKLYLYFNNIKKSFKSKIVCNLHITWKQQ